MTGFMNVRALADGGSSVASIRKVPSQASIAGWWVDLSMAAGNPPPNYYASDPLVAAVLSSSRGINHGDARAPALTYLSDLTLVTPTAGLVGAYLLLDYVLYYPFVDLDDLDTQIMDNTVTLPRYVTGEGLLPMLVSVAPTTGGGSFTFTYVNQDGVEKVAPTQSCSVASAAIASIVTSEQATAAGGRPFLMLASGDTGVQRIVSWTNIAPNGGLGALVLARQIATTAIREASVPSEKSWPMHEQMSEPIDDGAYLGLVVNCAATVAAGTLTGLARYTWG